MPIISSASFNYAFSFFFAITALLLGISQTDAQSPMESEIDSIPDLVVGGAEPYSIYENSSYGLRLEYPKSWTLEESEGGSDNPLELVYFYNDADDNKFNGDFSISIDKLAHSRTMQDYLQKMLKQYKRNVDGFKLDSTSWDTLGGLRAYSILYRENYNSTTDLKVLEVGAIRDGVVYFIEYFAFDKEFDKNFPIARKMIDSFQFIDARSQT
ncbi:MAG TPA: hypothetical protein VH415_11730 [Nitrososphaeraceae archaeon]|jgi:serine/threonine-protein kinase